MAEGTLDSSGLNIPTFEDIQRDNATAIQNGIGRPIDTSDNSVAGVLNTIVSASQTDVYELVQAIYNSFDINQATGVQLDRIGLNRGIRRNPQTATNGSLYFKVGWNNVPTAIPVNTLATDNTYTFATNSAVTVTQTNCTRIEVAIADDGAGEADSDTYTILVENIGKTINKVAGETPEDIVDKLIAAVDTDTRFEDVVTPSKQNDSQGRPWVFVLEADTTQNIQMEWVAGSVTANQSYVYSSTTASNLTLGNISVPANTVTTLQSTFTVPVEVNNPFTFNTGNARETDDEYRVRLLRTNGSTGSGTVDAIGTALDNLEGTVSVNVKENYLTVTDSEGLPSKSFQVIIQTSATDDEIAQIIWDTKPAGIRPFGVKTGEARDRTGAPQTMYFDRPVSIGYTLEVDWSSETDLDPVVVSEINTAIINAVTTAAGTVSVGRDLSPNFFYSAVYNASRDISLATIRLFVGGIEQSVLCVSDTEIAALEANGVTPQQVTHSC